MDRPRMTDKDILLLAKGNPPHSITDMDYEEIIVSMAQEILDRRVADQFATTLPQDQFDAFAAAIDAANLEQNK